jgi:hypothetical protein
MRTPLLINIGSSDGAFRWWSLRATAARKSPPRNILGRPCSFWRSARKVLNENRGNSCRILHVLKR